MFQESHLVEKTRLFAEQILKNLPPQLVYHNLTHTQRVVRYALEIGEHTALSAEQMEVLLLAAWTHDIGYAEGFDHHEERSKALVVAFLRDLAVPADLLVQVLVCIDATKVPQRAATLTAEVLADADLAHLAAQDCMQTSEQLRQELSKIHGHIEPLEWLKGSANFFVNHTYLTPYGCQVLAPQKQANYQELLLAIARLEG